MWFHVLACDYDGTLATAGRVAPETMEALRRMILVTGRRVGDATWLHRLRNGDVARWLRDEIEDPELTDEIATLEERDDATATRRAALAAIGRRHTPVAGPAPESGGASP